MRPHESFYPYHLIYFELIVHDDEGIGGLRPTVEQKGEVSSFPSHVGEIDEGGIESAEDSKFDANWHKKALS